MHDELKRKLSTTDVVGGVIGLGYVGLPLVRHLCEAGYKVIGYDVDLQKVDQLNRGESYIKHVTSEWIAEKVSSGLFEATSDFSRLEEADCLSICVPTPLNRNSEPDLQYVCSTVESITKCLRPGQLVILESTTYPGTIEELVLPILARSGLKVGEGFFLAYSPEREDPGNERFTIKNIPKVVGGVTDACTELTSMYYDRVFESVIKVRSPATAELTKLLENIFRSVNIALVNELKILCHRMGIDVWEVIEAASTKPFGFMPFYPGPGLGGHCIPIDPFYLSWKAREYDFVTRFIELAGEINTAMPYYVVSRVMDALNDRGVALRGSKVLILGIAYKKDIDDPRESPAVKIIELLKERGAIIDYNDPLIPRIPPMRKHDLKLESVELTNETLAEYDCVLIVTDHSAYEYDRIVDYSRLVVDTRNATRDVKKHREKIFHA